MEVIRVSWAHLLLLLVVIPTTATLSHLLFVKTFLKQDWILSSESNNTTLTAWLMIDLRSSIWNFLALFGSFLCQKMLYQDGGGHWELLSDRKEAPWPLLGGNFSPTLYKIYNLTLLDAIKSTLKAPIWKQHKHKQQPLSWNQRRRLESFLG